MTKGQENKEINSIKAYFEDVLSNREKSQKFFNELGSHDANGELTRNYKE